MGFYLRKSVNLGGGVRLNLSKSGLGLSAGVKGLRFGMNGRGTYVHMGRGGLYYRQQFSWNKKQKSQTEPAAPRRAAGYRPGPEYSDQGIYYSENLTLPLDVSSGAANVEDVLKHFRKRVGWTWVPVMFGAMALFMALSNTTLSAFLFLCCGLSLIAMALLRERTILIYDLDENAEKRFADFVNSIEPFMTTNSLWLYETRSATGDWKRNGGATSLINRRPAQFGIDKAIRSNISIPCLTSGKERIYFLPDLVVCGSGDKVTAFPYSEFHLEAHTTRFIEDEKVPSDAVIVDQTWRYVNKKGGPDRRFNNNRQIPVCAYQQLEFTAGPTFRRGATKSRQSDIQPLEKAISGLRTVMRAMKEVSAPTLLPTPTVMVLSERA